MPASQPANCLLWPLAVALCLEGADPLGWPGSEHPPAAHSWLWHLSRPATQADSFLCGHHGGTLSSGYTLGVVGSEDAAHMLPGSWAPIPGGEQVTPKIPSQLWDWLWPVWVEAHGVPFRPYNTDPHTHSPHRQQLLPQCIRPRGGQLAPPRCQVWGGLVLSPRCQVCVGVFLQGSLQSTYPGSPLVSPPSVPAIGDPPRTLYPSWLTHAADRKALSSPGNSGTAHAQGHRRPH